MKTCIIIHDENSWIKKYVDKLEKELIKLAYSVTRRTEFDEKGNYDIAFILSYSKKICEVSLNLNKHNLVVHESELPKGKGWSPLTWQILEGKEKIVVTLFEAEKDIDSGKIYLQKTIKFNGTELVEELREKQGEATIELCLEFVQNHEILIKNSKQQSGISSYYRKRDWKDSEININKTILEQINLLRVVDNERYPAFFIYKGEKFILKISKE